MGTGTPGLPHRLTLPISGGLEQVRHSVAGEGDEGKFKLDRTYPLLRLTENKNEIYSRHSRAANCQSRP
jgi:hypothetical protein